MAKTCIMCDKPAGSNEHVFPAALGGRRTSRQIYCTPHNNNFGRHVAVLEEQLSMMNAALRIRPDRHDEPKPFIFTGPRGEEYTLLGSNIEFSAPRPFDLCDIAPDGSGQLEVPSMEAFERLRAKVREEQGIELVIAKKGEITPKYFTEPLHVELSFGGNSALQAVAYLALTFFAQYFPAEARQIGLDRLKKFLLDDFNEDADPPGVWIPDLVWWDGRDTCDVTGTNPFKFGHTVVVGVSAEKRHAYAYISFFSALNFGVDLGPVDPLREGMATVFINPQAERPPHDIVCKRSEIFNVEVESLDTTLSSMIHSGSAEAAVQRFLDQVSEKHHVDFIEEIKSRLEGMSLTDSVARCNAAKTLIDQSGQRILNTLLKASTSLKEYLAGQVPPYLLSVLDGIVIPDVSQVSGLSLETSKVLEEAKAAIALKVQKELEPKDPDFDATARLLTGNLGVVVITETILMPRLLSAHQASSRRSFSL